MGPRLHPGALVMLQGMAMVCRPLWWSVPVTKDGATFTPTIQRTAGEGYTARSPQHSRRQEGMKAEGRREGMPVGKQLVV